MFPTNSQQADLARGISGVLFEARVLLQFPAGTSQSILGDVVWHYWVVWRPSRIYETGFAAMASYCSSHGRGGPGSQGLV